MHIPVLLQEVLFYLSPRDGCEYFDGTFGEGGYSKGILQSSMSSVLAVDRDAAAIPFAEDLMTQYPDRFEFLHSRYGNIAAILAGRRLDGIVLDLGVSSSQLDDEERGFSFKKSGALDMRMGLNDLSALEAIRRLSESQLADMIYQYGEERYSRRVAKNIKKNIRSIATTEDLANVVRAVLPRNYKKDPATRTFQALRIYVNNELEELTSILSVAPRCLKNGGRLVVVSFHSLEDRIVKMAFRKIASEIGDSVIMTKKPVEPSEEEVAANPRARSAKLRALEIRCSVEEYGNIE